MTKYISTFFLTITLYISTYGQSLTFFFKNLPPDCTPELTFTQRDSLLKRLDFVIPGGDSIETVKYTLDVSSPDCCTNQKYNSKLNIF